MKKILLSLMLITASVFGKTQGVVFNEFYPNPSIENKNPPTKFNHEYFELYNVSSSPIVLDCYTVLAYDNLAHQGYVYQFQNGLEISGNGFLVFTNSVTNPLTIRTDNLNSPVTYGPASNIVSWNQTDGTTGFMKLFTKSGSTLTASGSNLTNVDNFLLDPSSGEGISVFLF